MHVASIHSWPLGLIHLHCSEKANASDASAHRRSFCACRYLPVISISPCVSYENRNTTNDNVIVMTDVFRYQSLCRVNGNFDVTELNRQARLFGINPHRKQKRTLCKEIAEAVEVFLVQSKSTAPCKNSEDTDVVGDRQIKDLPSYLRWSRITPKGDMYCFSLLDMKQFIDNQVKRDPIGCAITDADRADIEEKYEMMSSILTPFGLTLEAHIHPLVEQWIDSARTNACFAKYIKDATIRDRLTHQLMLRSLVALAGIYDLQIVSGEYETRSKVMKTICSFTDGLPQPIVRYFFNLMAGAPVNMNMKTMWRLLSDFILSQPVWSRPDVLQTYPKRIRNDGVRAIVDDDEYNEDFRDLQEQQRVLHNHEHIQQRQPAIHNQIELTADEYEQDRQERLRAARQRLAERTAQRRRALHRR